LRALAISVLATGGFIGVMVASQPSQVRMSSFATPLEGRVRSQQLNARLSIGKINGAQILPGAEFSFNRVVGTWSRDAGYKKAPVSFNGQLVWTYGGGVCQTSSTLYNAALLAGLPIVERHRHRFAPGYVAPGRDAAVAYNNIDLRFSNPYEWPIWIRARVEDGRLICEIYGAKKPEDTVSIMQENIDSRAPRLVSRYSRLSSGRVLNPGKLGWSVSTYRVWANGSRELLSIDSYPPMNKIVDHTGAWDGGW
jgi:vancomycin resistance protein YoaR